MVAFGARKEKSCESSDSDISTDSKDYQVMLKKWMNLKNENLRLQNDLVQSREQCEDLAEELAAWSQRSLSGSTSGRTTGSKAGSSTARSCE
ncbi:hypothetical protein F2Q68_00017058 [Brassica cretica]|uniref:Uncharacterized protein n=1 Tax=Brassica cretica TaxID=69181 RepID=A0A8S9HER5_BRACR|nr:hypothetical protein F2Q68_00017058 [Brassica cretica]